VAEALTPFTDPARLRGLRKASAAARPPSRQRRILLAAAAVALLLFAVAVYHIQTDNGELVITADDPDVEVVIKQNGKEVRLIDTRTNKGVKLQAGLYDLELKDKPEDWKLSLDRVTIRRGDKVVATAERRPNEGAAKVGQVRCFRWGSRNVQAADFSPDGRSAVSGEWEGTVRLWDLLSGHPKDRLPNHNAPVRAVAFSPDGSKVLRGREGEVVTAGGLYLCDVSTGKEIRRFVGHQSRVARVAFSGDGKRVLAGDWAGGLCLWDVESEKELQLFVGHTDIIHAVAFAPDGKTAVSGSIDGTLRRWDLETGKELWRSWAGAGVTGLAFSRDGRELLSSGLDGSLRWWDAGTGKDVRRFTVQSDTLQAMALSPNGRWAVTGGGADISSGQWKKGTDFAVRLWDVAAGKELQCFKGHEGVVTWVTLSRDGRFALPTSEDGTMRLWRLPDPPAAEKAPKP
jgi:WD40 repeat protein